MYSFISLIILPIIAELDFYRLIQITAARDFAFSYSPILSYVKN